MEMAKINSCKNKFLQKLVPAKIWTYKILGTVILNLDMQNRQNPMHFEQENGLKPHFGPFLALNGPFLGQHIFFLKSKNVTFLDLLKANLMQKIRKN